jgi:Protein of unknown function (DUF1461)
VTAALATRTTDATLARRLAGVLVSVATGLLILGAVVLLLLSPLYIHPALDDAGSAAYLTAGGLAVDPAGAQGLSDRTVQELFLGPGTFAFPAPGTAAPFYDAAEASHLRDARTVLYGFLLVVAAGAVALVAAFAAARREAWPWRAISRGAGVLAIALGVIGVFAAVAFDQAFTLFHEVFFPGGNWSFDPRTERLVQLYPIPFWERTSTVLVGTALIVGAVVWWLARRRAKGLEAT